MITYSYVLQRKISDKKIQEFAPDRIPTQLPNVVYIEGPNSSGKSTLLNIIALGLYGVKSTKIHPALLDKMNLLLDTSYQKLKFSVDIVSENEHLLLTSKKADFNKTEIVIEESTNGKPAKPLSFESFENKYNLIYDIPSNPAERLYDLLKELREEQLNYGNRFKEFGWYLRKTIKEVSDCRDPKRLEEISQNLKQVTEEKATINGKLPQLEEFLDCLEKNAYVKLYYYHLNEYGTLQERKNELEAKSEQLNKDEKKSNAKVLRFRSDISNLQNSFSAKYNEVTPLIENELPKKDRPRIKNWKKINPYSTDTGDLNTIRTQTAYFMILFERELDKVRSEGSYKNAEMLGKIIESLKEFEDSSLEIPQIKVTVGDLIRILKEESKKNFVLMSRFDNLTAIVNLLETLKNDTESSLQKLKELGEASAQSVQVTDEYGKSYYEQKEQLQTLENDLEKTRGKIDYYLHKCLSKNIDRKKLEGLAFFEMAQTLPKSDELKPLLSLNENQIEEKISALGQEISEKRKRLISCDIYIEQYQKEKDRLENQEPHKYERYRDQMDSLLRKAEALSQKLLREYNDNIKNLIERKVKKDNIEKEKRPYYEEVSKYLAHRIGSFRHIDAVYRPQIVDLISGIIITEDGITIHIADMGTGQSQSAYIMSLLNITNDNRKIIAMFDEIAMMDDKSLEPIYKRMKDLYRENKLLVGIMIQKSNEVNVRSLIE
jgi:exonuclease SbcC